MSSEIHGTKFIICKNKVRRHFTLRTPRFIPFHTLVLHPHPPGLLVFYLCYPSLPLHTQGSKRLVFLEHMVQDR